MDNSENFEKMAKLLAYRLAAQAARSIAIDTNNPCCDEVVREKIACDIAPYLVGAIKETYQLGFIGGQRAAYQEIFDAIPVKAPGGV